MSRRSLITLAFLAIGAAASLWPVHAQTQSYTAQVITSFKVDYPAADSGADSQTGHDPAKPLVSNVQSGYTPFGYIQAVSAIANPGAVGVSTHGQTQIVLPGLPNISSSTTEKADASVIDFITASASNIVNGKIHFSLYTDGEITAYFDQRTQVPPLLQMDIEGGLSANGKVGTGPVSSDR